MPRGPVLSPEEARLRRKERTYAWRKVNPGKAKAIQKRSADKRKSLVYEHYGNFCACCGESELEFLTIDHKNNDGASHRKSLGFKASGDQLYRDIIKSNFPDDLRVLCWNCNCGRQRNNGVCPHEQKVSGVIWGDAKT